MPGGGRTRYSSMSCVCECACVYDIEYSTVTECACDVIVRGGVRERVCERETRREVVKGGGVIGRDGVKRG